MTEKCRAVINLFNRDDHCELEAGHHGPHQNQSYGPTIHWTANRYWATDSIQVEP